MSAVVCCPHCGGKSGTETNIRFKAVRVYSWDGSDVDTDNWEITAESGHRCQDCGKPIRKFTDCTGKKGSP